MYNCDDYVKPIWDTSDNIMLHESFMPVAEPDSDDKGLFINLLYRAGEIISVMNSLQTVTYVDGKDYILRGGGIYIPANSDIRIIPRDVYNPKEKLPNAYSPNGFTCTTGGYLLFAEGAEIHKMQYEVSYKHSDKWTGFIPQYNEDKLPRVRRILKTGEGFTLGFFGDSITAGANSSKLVNSEPYAPIWCEMAWEKLKELSGCNIKYVNKAVGGTSSEWGIKNVTECFKDDIPDLFVIAFGMNDASGKVNKLTFRDNCKSIADKILTLNPDCEIIFVSTTMPNPIAAQFISDHDTHEDLLYEISESYGVNSETARVNTLHKYLMTKKHYYDMTGNNINHPNDFLARVYAQTVLKCIIKY